MDIWKTCTRTYTIHLINGTRSLRYNNFSVYNNKNNNRNISDLLDVSSGSMPVTDLTPFTTIPAKQ